MTLPSVRHAMRIEFASCDPVSPDWLACTLTSRRAFSSRRPVSHQHTAQTFAMAPHLQGPSRQRRSEGQAVSQFREKQTSPLGPLPQAVPLRLRTSTIFRTWSVRCGYGPHFIPPPNIDEHSDNSRLKEESLHFNVEHFSSRKVRTIEHQR
ncbi:hypothetical protein BS50DRAFT_577518 [Corynespora cassiicola Philippines]|uniref:Uncharacterized protein n=1 Tax=Corynespora cassiicola Philippines TaxID=1448308 RepID=A0A2T2NB68_CORCC|nr:hypothetical protein BS50DRAFT_577518 [Corynespora cassiicola Philippines]